ncbi:hypothetical protein AUCHE_01_00570 [Austwickia chelonae NBRC 105200]|uniref:Uncharacterized protein n=1 Tax=Austwickia chelonae NBRC 105200 TaxID=1184607 RepID=K6VMB9_9MICO|nr:hypothetical protein AUCHE_01_00570 [Austwickia chelonae NBRC 105200]
MGSTHTGSCPWPPELDTIIATDVIDMADRLPVEADSSGPSHDPDDCLSDQGTPPALNGG